MSTYQSLTLRKLRNSRADRELLRQFNEKMGAYEKTLNPLFDKEITIKYNSPWRALRSSSVLVLVAEKDGEPQGYIVGSIKDVPSWWKGGRYGYIQCLYVNENARGLGIATQMFEELKNWFAQKGVHTFMLRHFHNNAQATALYKKWGFEPFIDQLMMQIPPIEGNG